VAVQPAVRLLTVEPDVGRFLTPDERVEAAELSVSVVEIERGPLAIGSVLGKANAFSAFILNGLILHRLQVADQSALRLLGPGDIVSLSGGGPSLLAESSYRVAAPARLAMLGNEILMAARRWPRIVAGLHVRAREQVERLGTQLAICQLPRVDQRIVALMWMLAESWGTVTAHGTRLPLLLTHDALGGMIGARRPTVTLALRELTDRGAIVRQSDGWLLLEGPPEPSAERETIGEPRLAMNGTTDWSPRPQAQETREALWAELRENVTRLHEQHRHNTEHFQQQKTRTRYMREQFARSRIAREALRRRLAPSS
jgi:CRP/FNR family transcriptional regulator, cyclic AMP receptor protein